MLHVSSGDDELKIFRSSKAKSDSHALTSDMRAGLVPRRVTDVPTTADILYV